MYNLQERSSTAEQAAMEEEARVPRRSSASEPSPHDPAAASSAVSRLHELKHKLKNNSLDSKETRHKSLPGGAVREEPSAATDDPSLARATSAVSRLKHVSRGRNSKSGLARKRVRVLSRK